MQPASTALRAAVLKRDWLASPADQRLLTESCALTVATSELSWGLPHESDQSLASPIRLDVQPCTGIGRRNCRQILLLHSKQQAPAYCCRQRTNDHNVSNNSHSFVAMPQQWVRCSSRTSCYICWGICCGLILILFASSACHFLLQCRIEGQIANLQAISGRVCLLFICETLSGYTVEQDKSVKILRALWQRPFQQ